MPDFILMEGDQATFLPGFGNGTVFVDVSRPGNLQGSGPATWNGKKICVDGDEQKVSVPAALYTTLNYPIPGTGTLKIDALAGDQKAKKIKTGGKAVLLKGGLFTARFEVQSPAQQPPPGPGSPIPDPTPQYSGQGLFLTTNTKFQGT